MVTLNSLAQDIKDILDILKTAVLPTLTRLENKVSELDERQSSIEKKLDVVAKTVTINQKTTDSRFRVLESKAGIFHD